MAKNLKLELQEFTSELGIFQQKCTSNEHIIKTLQLTLTDMNREVTKIKQQYMESSFKRTLAENQIKSLRNELNGMKTELKLKNILILNLETENRKINQRLKSLNKTNDKKIDISDKCGNQRILLTEKSKYQDIEATNKGKQFKSQIKDQILIESKEKIDKTIALQSLVLNKSKELAEKQLIIEEYEKQLIQINQRLNKMIKFKKFKLISIKPISGSNHQDNLKSKSNHHDQLLPDIHPN